ncbi:Gfo/Idh/MocA family oxidoreductase [Dactylosporangium siamense]|uniref:Dehydrogenase n=1 Tax=Dactylosporangium siamense TaxID=685454 RepID=A0A919PI18_9ACTN|nr:Gfo/Idh/MocA family oxidoreductase [Dactylosporangium siamense]GIG45196.1 hypothetical protein Dsi01nite_032370 [Dactylosporangium siamense]
MRAVTWPAPGVVEVIDSPEPVPGPGEAMVDIAVSVLSPGTERARFLGLPTAVVPFPHSPGYLAAGFLRGDGSRVAVRGIPHRAVAAVPPGLLCAVPGHVPLVDAAVWQLALTARYGMAVGAHRAGEPATVVGAGLLGLILRRLLAAEGAPAVRGVASSMAKAWAAEAEPATTFGPGERSLLTFDASGSAAGLAVAVDATADGGRIVLLGSPRADIAEVPLRELYDRRIALVGAHTVNLDAAGVGALSEPFFALLAGGRFSVADVVREYPAGDAPALYRRLVDDPAFVAAALRWTPDRAVPLTAPLLVSGRAAAPLLPAPDRMAEAPDRAEEAPDRAEEAPDRAVPRAVPRDRPVRFGLIGCGDIGIKDAEALAAASGAALVACHDPVDRLAAEVAAAFGARAEPGVEALLARPDVDAVLIATPHDTHEPLAVAALDAGKHVLLEKPLANDLRSARRIAAAAATAATAGTVTSVLFPMRTDSRFLQAHAALTGGLVGTPLGVSASYLVDKPGSYFRSGFSGRSPSSWRLSRARSGGGFLIMNLVHQIDLIRALLGVEADRVFAETSPSAAAPEIEDVVTVVMRFGPVIATLVGGASVPGADGQRLHLWGDAGRLEVLPGYTLTTRTPRPGLAVPPDVDPRVLAIDRFVASIRTGAPPDVTVDDALAVQALAEAAYESARSGRAVAPAPDGRFAASDSRLAAPDGRFAAVEGP